MCSTSAVGVQGRRDRCSRARGVASPSHREVTGKPAFERHGAKFLARGGKTEVLEGKARARNVIIEFPSMEEALACYHSPEYQAASKIRQSVSEGEFVLVEGV